MPLESRDTALRSGTSHSGNDGTRRRLQTSFDDKKLGGDTFEPFELASNMVLDSSVS
jgi:hypothetical protein